MGIKVALQAEQHHEYWWDQKRGAKRAEKESETAGSSLVHHATIARLQFVKTKGHGSDLHAESADRKQRSRRITAQSVSKTGESLTRFEGLGATVIPKKI